MESAGALGLNKNSSIIGAVPDTLSPSVNTKFWRQEGEKETV